jgi:hypothetical protein
MNRRHFEDPDYWELMARSARSRAREAQNQPLYHDVLLEIAAKYSFLADHAHEQRQRHHRLFWSQVGDRHNRRK